MVNLTAKNLFGSDSFKILIKRDDLLKKSFFTYKLIVEYRCKMDNINISGLSEEEAAQRLNLSKTNRKNKSATKSYKQIFFENIFSLFNFINAAIAIVLLEVGSVKNCLFMLVVICNTFIGIAQEIRSKRVIDKLSIVNQSKVNVIRSGKSRNADISELVKDDIIELNSGCQIPNDCVIVSGSCEVNEALVTGESDSVFKPEGEKLLSGSFVVSGKCLCRIVGVGSENYADSLLGQIKYVKKSSSEIVDVIRKIIVVISICIIPFGGLLFYNQYTLSHSTLKEAVESSAAALIGMIPEGLVLLISTVFAMGVIRLSKRNVLSQDLYSLETLARTDVLCLDKTGTVTTGEMNVEKIVAVNGSEEELENLVKIIANNSEDGNATVTAIKNSFSENIECTVTNKIPFSSDRKWSAICTNEFRNIIMGSAEMIFKSGADYSALNGDDLEKYRVVAVAVTNSDINDFTLPYDTELKGFVLMSEKVRESVADTFKYFAEEDVQLKIISGDNPVTVQKLCGSVFNENCGCVDMSAVGDEDIPNIVEENKIFGRATPTQKKLIVSALKSKGHTVGMVGDGVNDVLALKESDCSIALANGSAATRNISRLVLLDSDFSSLPQVVSEGRRSINNLQNSASLFLAKTIFSAVMTLIFMFINYPYPFEPIQMTLVSCLTIGFPSFVLSFLKNNKRISGSFLKNIIRNSVPAAVTNIAAVLTIVLLAEFGRFDELEVSSLCVTALAVTGIMLIIRIYKPLTPLRIFVIAASVSGFVLAFSFLAGFFGLASVLTNIDVYMIITAISDAVVLWLLMYFFGRHIRTQ